MGPKTRLWLASKKYQGSDQVMVQMAAEHFYEAVLSIINPRIEEAVKRLEDVTVGAKNKIEKIPNEMLEEGKNHLKSLVQKTIEGILEKGEDAVKTAVQKKVAEIERLPQIQGRPGVDATPLRPGVDYLTKEQADAYLQSLNAKIFTKEETQRLIGEAMSSLFNSEKKGGLSEAGAKKLVEDMIKALPIDQIVRSIEALPQKQKLDYHKGLKNQPSDTTAAPAQRVLHRGTSSQGSQTYYYDLSDLCDGVTKVFTIPTNTRVLDVGCTDAPNGRYRPGVDWTGTGTVTLTLSADVAAPTTGATLYILYVA